MNENHDSQRKGEKEKGKMSFKLNKAEHFSATAVHLSRRLAFLFRNKR